MAKSGGEHGGPGPVREGFPEQVTFARWLQAESSLCIGQEA